MKFPLTKVIVLLTAVVLAGVTSHAKSWRGIVPLKSTRADVERLLGKPNELGRYQFEKERAYIHYKNGPCSVGDESCECYAADDTVREIYVQLEDSLKFARLIIDKTKFKKNIYPEDRNLAVYSNDVAGIIYVVSLRDGDVVTIQYLPSAKDCRELSKKKKAKVSAARITKPCS